MIYLSVCDDTKADAEWAENLLAETSRELGLDVEIHSFLSLEELLHAVKEEKQPIDMLFLDIEFGEENSLAAAGEIAALLPRCRIVFLTHYLSYALDVYEIPHLYFAVKEEFPQRIRKIFQAYFGSEREEKLPVTFGGKTEIIPLREILYIERSRRSCSIFTDSGTYKTAVYFEDLADKIKAPYMVRCHNSFVVNLQYVRQYSAEAFVLVNGTTVPISRMWRQKVRDRFQSWQEIWI